eukprot:gene16942-20154_t
MFFCSWKWRMDEYNAQMVMLGDPQMEGDYRLGREGLKGQYNIWFNDNYFRHIVANIAYFLAPSHVIVLGDLFSSQYINDAEFERRTARYRRIFDPLQESNTMLINVTGNHDIGYGNEASRERINRFESAFGRVNEKFYVAGHIVAVLNSINLDSNSRYSELRDETWQFLREVTEERRSTGTPVILATHIPLYKAIDPEYKYQPNLPTPYHAKPLCIERFTISLTAIDELIREQSMLTPETSTYILDELQPIFVFNGHDHDGCIYRHNNLTVESMMGEFGGYSGLFEIKKTLNQSLLAKEKREVTSLDASAADNNNGNTNEDHYEYSFKICPFLETKYVNITFGVTAGWLLLWALFNLVLLAIRAFKSCFAKKKQVKDKFKED